MHAHRLFHTPSWIQHSWWAVQAKLPRYVKLFLPWAAGEGSIKHFWRHWESRNEDPFHADNSARLCKELHSNKYCLQWKVRSQLFSSPRKTNSHRYGWCAMMLIWRASIQALTTVLCQPAKPTNSNCELVQVLQRAEHWGKQTSLIKTHVAQRLIWPTWSPVYSYIIILLSLQYASPDLETRLIFFSVPSVFYSYILIDI